ncbi:MAG: ABC transporter permease [marine bacterium B5-7]|nr:MAG: ABC transporter permease [marine bacterium B5-7]
MLALLAILREWRRHPWQIGLNIVGIAIGVAVVVAVDLANHNAERAYLEATSAINGIATHRISSVAVSTEQNNNDLPVRGIDESLYTLIKVDLGIFNAAPVIRGPVMSADRQLTLLGIDPLSDYRLRGFTLNNDGMETKPFPLFVPASLAKSEDIAVGDVITLVNGAHKRLFTVAGLIEAGAKDVLPGDVVITDIAAAQVFFDLSGRLSYIDLKLDDETRIKTLRETLPPEVQLISTGSRDRARLEMTRAFRINLSALALLALTIGLFLIYNTVSFQVVRRRPLFGLMRSIGVTRGQLFVYLLGEAAVLAVIGIAVGLLLGIALSDFLYAMVTGTIDNLYFHLAGGSARVEPFTLLKSAALGFGATLLAAAVPGFEARNTPPRALTVRSYQEVAASHSKIWAGVALLSILIATLLIVLSDRSLITAFVALFLIIIGSAALAPIGVRGLARLLTPLAAATGSVILLMAVRNLVGHLSRTGIATAALAVAVAATLGVGLMIDSFRTSVDTWLNSYLRADIYISGARDSSASLSKSTIDTLAAMDGVLAMSLGRRFVLEDSIHGPLNLFALNTTRNGFEGFVIKSAQGNDLWQRFSNSGEVMVSEAFANRFNLSPGDSFAIDSHNGRQELTIAAVYFDYSTDRGVMSLSPATFQRLFNAPVNYSAAALYLEDGDAAVTNTLKEIEQTINTDGALYVRSNRTLRDTSLEIFDQTFKVTGILRLLAIVVAVTGIISALMALMLERAREFATLRATGFTRMQLFVQMLMETGLTGLAAGLLAIPMGLALCLLLIHVINLRSFGWSMQTIIDPAMVMGSVLLSLTAALVAGLYPALRLARSSIAGGLRNE